VNCECFSAIDGLEPMAMDRKINHAKAQRNDDWRGDQLDVAEEFEMRRTLCVFAPLRESFLSLSSSPQRSQAYFSSAFF
jgi:hypothetical protein